MVKPVKAKIFINDSGNENIFKIFNKESDHQNNTSKIIGIKVPSPRPIMQNSFLFTGDIVKKGEKVAATRSIPLIMKRRAIEQAAAVAGRNGPVLKVTPLRRAQAGLIITGNEVYHGLIEDRFVPVLTKKLSDLGSEVSVLDFVPDESEQIARVIRSDLEKGCDLLLLSGGMSVDPDDITRVSIADAGAEDVVYGTPVLPGAMFLYGRFGDIPVLGLPACVLFYRATIFDLILPRVLAGEIITRRDLAELAHGGLCLNCEHCRFPVCPFGK